jgi:hypothetical protein
MNIKSAYSFTLQLSSETFLILRRFQRYIIINLHVKYPLSGLNGSSILSTDFEKYVNMKFHENPSSGSSVVSCGQGDIQLDRRTDGRTDRHYEAYSRLFRDFAKAPKPEMLQ